MLEGSWEISDAERSEMQRLRDELGNKFCRRCDYCQPCTQEIPISSVMVIKSAIRRLPPERLFIGAFADAVEKATNCTECGDCEERCPFKLPIREILHESIQCFQATKQKYDKSVGT